MKNTKMMVAVLMGMLLMVTAAYAGPDKGEFGRGFGKWAAVMKDLTPEQVTQAKALRLEGLKKHEEFRAQIAKKRIELEEMAVADKPDEQALIKKQQEIWALKDQARNEFRSMKLKFRAILTPEQKKKFGLIGLMGKGFGMHGCMCGGMMGGCMMGGKGGPHGGGMMGGRGDM